MRLQATHVRCMVNERTGAKAWLFYAGEKRAYLSWNKLHQTDNVYTIDYLTSMKARENRRFVKPVELYVVRGRKKGNLLVHRIETSDGMVQPKKQQGMDL